jgi:hypothetical protein
MTRRDRTGAGSRKTAAPTVVRDKDLQPETRMPVPDYDGPLFPDMAD